MTFAPGKKQAYAATGAWERDLATDIARLREHYGIDHLVCLIEDRELEELAIPDLVEQAEAAGMAVHRLPIADFSVPADLDEARKPVDAIIGWSARVRTR